VALRFLTRLPAVFAIPKAAKPEHAADNAGAVQLRLTAGDIARLEQAFPRGPRPRSLPML
jgi:diketogulonate reductase-like aldo/keto reductase